MKRQKQPNRPKTPRPKPEWAAPLPDLTAEDLEAFAKAGWRARNLNVYRIGPLLKAHQVFWHPAGFPKMLLKPNGSYARHQDVEQLRKPRRTLAEGERSNLITIGRMLRYYGRLCAGSRHTGLMPGSFRRPAPAAISAEIWAWRDEQLGMWSALAEDALAGKQVTIPPPVDLDAKAHLRRMSDRLAQAVVPGRMVWSGEETETEREKKLVAMMAELKAAVEAQFATTDAEVPDLDGGDQGFDREGEG